MTFFEVFGDCFNSHYLTTNYFPFSENFLSHLGNKLNTSNNTEEKKAVAAIIWAMVANNQKAKLCMRSAGLDARLQLAAASVPSSRDLVELFDFIVSLISPCQS